MNVQTSFSGTPDDLKAMMLESLQIVVTPLVERLRELEVAAGARRHAYTVAEVAEQISFHSNTVLEFIHTGRKAKNGRLIQLKAKEISKGVYRIIPKDLDEWLAHF